VAITKFLARDLTIEYNTGTVGTPVWTPIGGLNTLTHAPSSTDADTTDFDSDGRAEHMKAERGDQWTLAGFHEEDVADGSRDPGQEAIETLANGMGLNSLGQFRITSPGGNTETFMASAEVTRGSGGNNDAATWQASVTISGAVTYA
jgi:hypothetical protein